MKRSFLIEMIVYEALSWDGLNTSGVPREEIANDVLKICEKFGMLPPSIEVKGKTEFSYWTNEWELEDEN